MRGVLVAILAIACFALVVPTDAQATGFSTQTVQVVQSIPVETRFIQSFAVPAVTVQRFAQPKIVQQQVVEQEVIRQKFIQQAAFKQRAVQQQRVVVGRRTPVRNLLFGPRNVVRVRNVRTFGACGF